MGESRDANDPRDLMRAMNKQAREEFEGTEQSDTGGQAHASRADRERSPARDRRLAGGQAAPTGGHRTAGKTPDEE